jgi:hypothetical protein
MLLLNPYFKLFSLFRTAKFISLLPPSPATGFYLSRTSPQWDVPLFLFCFHEGEERDGEKGEDETVEKSCDRIYLVPQ